MSVTIRSALRLVMAMLFCIVSSATLDAADSPNEIKKRMKANLPKIEVLKKQGRVGENNKGYIEGIDKKLSKKEIELLELENKDRKLIYEYLARKTKTTVLKVTQTRVAQIRKRSAPGLWLQDGKGKWFKKPKPPLKKP
ncbi:MAG TPA: DUF1318 domain-containing protein [Verrucomicrobiales bacterium]|nr:DUF1318 domain-containing protein [Verrucomicrobiales bacterium]HIL68322.1 DUF1318 domain-containing protein [Verrucomicrobiota bacterium]